MTDATTQQHPIKPGDVLNIDNRANRAQRVWVRTGAGTEFNAVLTPGASLSITAGHEALDIRVEDSDASYAGLKPVK